MTTIHPTAVVSPGAEIGEGAVIGPYCVLGPEARIGAGARLMSHVVVDGRTTVGPNCTLFPFACVGTQTQDLKFRGARTSVEIGEGTTLREYVTVNASTNEGEVTRVGARCHIMAYCHVAHFCQVGNEVILSNGATLAGHVVVEDQAIIGGLSGIHQFVRVGTLCMVGGMTKITQDCPPYMLVDGNPASVYGVNRIGMERRNVAPRSRELLKDAYRILYRQDLSTTQALARIRADVESCPEIEKLIGFVERSERGIIK